MDLMDEMDLPRESGTPMWIQEFLALSVGDLPISSGRVYLYPSGPIDWPDGVRMRQDRKLQQSKQAKSIS
jgi:hypothetical protein